MTLKTAKPPVNIFLTSIRFVLTRAMFGYLIMFFVSHVVIDFDKIKFGLGLRQLNFMMPQSYDFLLEVEKMSRPPDKQTLEKYAQFYTQIVRVLPRRADAYGMLGFCYYHLGDYQSAIKAFEKAHEIQPDYFWFSYNLGVLYFNLHQEQKALEYFKMAITYDLNISFNYVLNSKEVYMPILKTFEDPKSEAETRLLEAAKFCRELVQVLNLKSANRSVSLPSQLVIRIF